MKCNAKTLEKSILWQKLYAYDIVHLALGFSSLNIMYFSNSFCSSLFGSKTTSGCASSSSVSTLNHFRLWILFGFFIFLFNNLSYFRFRIFLFFLHNLHIFACYFFEFFNNFSRLKLPETAIFWFSVSVVQDSTPNNHLYTHHENINVTTYHHIIVNYIYHLNYDNEICWQQKPTNINMLLSTYII